MAEQKIKFKVSIKELSFEFEGTREVGQALQAGLNRSLGRLLDTQRVAMALPSPTPAPTLFDTGGPVETPTNGHAPDSPARNGKPTPAAEKPKRTRKSGNETAMGLLRGLITDGYFKEARTVDNDRPERAFPDSSPGAWGLCRPVAKNGRKGLSRALPLGAAARCRGVCGWQGVLSTS